MLEFFGVMGLVQLAILRCCQWPRRIHGVSANDFVTTLLATFLHSGRLFVPRILSSSLLCAMQHNSVVALLAGIGEMGLASCVCRLFVVTVVVVVVFAVVVCRCLSLFVVLLLFVVVCRRFSSLISHRNRSSRK